MVRFHIIAFFVKLFLFARRVTRLGFSSIPFRKSHCFLFFLTARHTVVEDFSFFCLKNGLWFFSFFTLAGKKKKEIEKRKEREKKKRELYRAYDDILMMMMMIILYDHIIVTVL